MANEKSVDEKNVQEIMEAVERAAAKEALEKIAEKHVQGVLEVRQQVDIDDAQLTSRSIYHDQRIDMAKRKELGTLHERIKALVTYVAKKLKDSQYKTLEMGLEEAGIPLKKRRIGQELVESFKEIDTCHQSFLLTVTLLTEFNAEIATRIREIENKLQTATGTSLERREYQNLLFANAILVYEVYDYLVMYFTTYGVSGVEQVESMYHACLSQIEGTRAKHRRNRASTEANLSAGLVSKEYADTSLMDIHHQEAALQRVVEEWDRLLSDIKRSLNKNQEIRAQVPLFEMFRNNAETQIEVLSAMSILQAVQGGFNAMSSAEKILKEMELVPLDLDRVNLLLDY